MNYKNTSIIQASEVLLKKRKFETTTVEYVKMVLSKVSFDVSLFEKELFKALSDLLPAEVAELKNWCYSHFSQDLVPVLNKVF